MLVEAAKSCNALVMSGGGSNGAWEAGVIWGLVHYGNPKDFEWDVVSGVSAGSINSIGIGVWAPGDEVQGSKALVDIWSSLTNDQIYTIRPQTSAIALFNAPGVYDTTVGLATIKSILERYDGYKKKVSASAVDANTGNKVTFTDDDVPFDQFYKAVMGSASVPGAFPPTSFNGHLLMDGMTAYNTDVQATIDRCKEITGHNESMITVDILQISAPDSIAQWDKVSSNAWTNYSRKSDLQSVYHGSDQLEATKRAHPKIHWRHHIV